MSHAELTETVKLGLHPKREGYIDVTVEYEIPPATTRLTVGVPSGAEMVRVSGFDGGGRYTWDGTTAEPSLRFVIPADNDTSRFSGYSFVDKGSWAITQAPSLRTTVSSESGTTVEHRREFTVEGDGLASNDGYMIYVGPNRSLTTSGQHERFRLAIPSVATLREPTVSVLQSLSAASETFEIGARSAKVVALAAPNDEADWGLTAGLQSGSCGFWTRDTQRVGTPHNTWVHEYIHTRQDFQVTASTRWLIEGSANYYAALLSFEQGAVSYDSFYRTVTTTKDENATLADPDTWPSPFTDYKKGMRALAALDAEIRKRSDDATLQDVFRELNARDDAVTTPEFKSIVVSVADESLSGWIDRYVRSPDAPAVPEDPELYELKRVVPVPGPQPACPACMVPVERQYCGQCGLELDKQCPGCDSPILGTETYCGACGRNLRRRCEYCQIPVGDRTYCPDCGSEIEG